MLALISVREWGVELRLGANGSVRNVAEVGFSYSVFRYDGSAVDNDATSSGVCLNALSDRNLTPIDR